LRDGAIECQHPLVCGVIDMAGKLDRDGAVATWKKSGW
jgi:hypothetical protein